MKIKNIINFAVVAAASVAATSCDDFLDRPAEDTYNAGNFYQNDEQCIQGVNFLYASPWYDFMRGYISVGEVMSGNYYMGSNAYHDFTLNGTDKDLGTMSASLWSAASFSSIVYNYINGGGASEEVKKTCMGEALTWRAMAYFYLVRTFGDIPICHDISETVGSGSYVSQPKVRREDVYEYICMTLEKAMELLPPTNSKGRIDYYCAEALLAKVYLTRAGLGMSGSRNEDHLAKAAAYAKDVIEHSGRNLLPVYSDIFRLQNNSNEESLIGWRWNASREPWTSQNSIYCELAPVGFTNFGNDCWGEWNGISVDLMDEFGYDILANPDTRIDTDSRRKATFMGPGDKYDYFWTDKGGFDYLKFLYDPEYGKGGPGECKSATGAYPVKHLYGNTYDHVQALGVSPDNMACGLDTHLLRLADVYLIYAEAVLGNNSSTSDASALDCYNKVRGRAVANYTPKTSITFDDIFKERRLELAMEGDYWYDLVRLSYYDPQRAVNIVKNQRRNPMWNTNALFKYYFENGEWDIQKAATSEDAGTAGYDNDTPAPNVTIESFTIPFPTQDVVINPNLLKPAVELDVRNTYSY